jgi:hypothetical protein
MARYVTCPQCNRIVAAVNPAELPRDAVILHAECLSQILAAGMPWLGSLETLEGLERLERAFRKYVDEDDASDCILALTEFLRDEENAWRRR